MDTKTPERLALEARATEAKVPFTDATTFEDLTKDIEKAKAKPAAKPKATAKSKARPTAKPKAKVAAKSEGDSLEVVGPRQGRWRCGRHFTKETTTILLSDLKDGEEDALRADPNLTVTPERPKQ